MKIARAVILFLGSAIVGGGAVRVWMSAWPQVQRAVQHDLELDRQSKAAAASPPVLPDTDGVMLKMPPELVAARSAKGPELAALFRVILDAYGIDPEWAGVLSAADASGFSKQWEKLRALAAGQGAGVLGMLFFGRWAALDPDGALAFLESCKAIPDADALLGQWALLDLSKAAAAASALGEHRLSRMLCKVAISQPKEFLKWTMEHPNADPLNFSGVDRDENVAALKTLLTAFPDKVVEWSRNMPPGRWSDDEVGIFASHMAKRGIAEALVWARSLDDPHRTNKAISTIAGEMAERDPAGAVSLLVAGRKVGENEYGMECASAFQKLGALDPDKAMDSARLLHPGTVRDTVIHRLLEDLLAADPARGFALADRMGAEATPNVTYGAPREIRTAEEARALMQGSLEGEPSVFRRTQFMRGLSAWMVRDQASLGAFLLAHTTPAQLDELGPGMRDDFLRMGDTGQGLDPTLEKALGFGAGDKVAHMAARDPAAASVALAALTDPGDRAMGISNISRAWAGQEVGDAAAWAVTLTDPGEQQVAWKTIADQWLKEDSRQASEWISGLPHGAARDATVLVLTERIGSTDPDLAWQWALNVGDGKVRSEALSGVARAWNKKDPAGLKAVLADPDFPASDRAAILNQLSPIPAPR